jgi:arsenate reductase
MAHFKIYYNPRCRKCRESNALLEEKGIDAEQILYLENAPTEEQLWKIHELLGGDVIQMVRTNEPVFKELGLSKNSSDVELVNAIAENPILLQRPIVIKDDNEAVIGRPPENIEALLD